MALLRPLLALATLSLFADRRAPLTARHAADTRLFSPQVRRLDLRHINGTEVRSDPMQTMSEGE